MIHLPRGIAVRENVNPARINLPEAMDKLRSGNFTGYLRFDASQGSGVIIFENGKLVSSLFVNADETERLIAYDAIARVFEISILGHATLNIYRLSSSLATALHALLHGQYIYKGQDLKLIDIRALLRRVKEEQLTGCLRVMAGDQTALIFYDQGHPLGFFHDGSSEIVTTADLSRSVAKLPGARVDLMKTGHLDGLILADLMASADLRPLWQRARKVLLEDRRQREEAAMRSLEEEMELRKQRILSQLKVIAGNHIGKFGVAQVEKAIAHVSLEMRPAEMEIFYREMQRLAKLVAGPSKIAAMLDEMKKAVKIAE